MGPILLHFDGGYYYVNFRKLLMACLGIVPQTHSENCRKGSPDTGWGQGTSSNINSGNLILAVTSIDFREIFNLPSYVNFRKLLMAHSWLAGIARCSSDLSAIFMRTLKLIKINK